MIVELYNIQSIKQATYDIEEKGVTQIVGDNSNGKSILVKAMAFVANTSILDKNACETIISDTSNVGVITMKRNGMTLKVNISRVRENCYYALTTASGKTITRTIREGGLEILSSEFGWVSFDGGICLQIFETFGIMPFVNNRPSSDYEIIDYIISDKVANDFIETYEKVTYPEFAKLVNSLKAKVSSIDSSLESIAFYNIPKYEDMLHKLRAYYRNIQHFVYYTPSRLPIYKTVPVVEVSKYIPTRLPIVRFIKPVEELFSLRDHIVELNSVLNGVCPTCGTVVKNME